jgi:hypothetical protein
VVFLGVAVWLAVAETRAPAPTVETLVATGSRGQAASLGLLVAAVLAGVPRYGGVDELLIGTIGLGAVVVAAARGDAVPQPRRRRAWPYALVGLIAALNELTAYLLQTSPAADWRHPALSDVMNPAFAWAPTRGVLVLCWLAGGLWLLHAMPQRSRAGDKEGKEQPEEGTR